MAAHTDQVVTYEDVLNSEHEFAPKAATLAKNRPAPLQLDADGKYALPEPG